MTWDGTNGHVTSLLWKRTQLLEQGPRGDARSDTYICETAAPEERKDIRPLISLELTNKYSKSFKPMTNA